MLDQDFLDDIVYTNAFQWEHMHLKQHIGI